MRHNLLIRVCKCFLVFWALNPVVTTAQIIPDRTLPVNSRINLVGNTIQIDGGTSRGQNLYHSFSEFSLITGETAAFNNKSSVQNIISRVTGQIPSNIDGVLKANGNTNLFLLNSNGILFGPNARLESGGSFLVSTANSVSFEDGSEFTSSAHETTPILSIRTPIGLSFRAQTGNIVVQGDGHRLRGPGGEPVTAFDAFGPGLEVQPGKTLGLIGGGIKLDGAVLSAKSGNLQIGGVNQGFVAINRSIFGYTLDYSESSTFSDVALTNRASLSASGLGNGSIHVQGKNITIDKGAVAIMQNFGFFPSGDLKFTAAQQLAISGTDPVSRILSGIYSESFAAGNGGTIRISSPKLILSEAGMITTKTFGIAKAGDIFLDIPELTQISGVSPRTPSAFSSVNSLTGNSRGRTGDISLSTKNLSITDGALLGTLSVSSGKGGNVAINASNSIFVSGVEKSLLTPALITASAFRDGDAGSVTINTSNLVVRNGGRVDSSTTFTGSAGRVAINASNLVVVSGTVPGSRNPSLISSSASILDDSLLDAFSIFKPVGTSGDVTIRTKNLLVKDGGRVSVQNDGPNNAGQLKVIANRINVENNGALSASTNGGNGGNIQLFSNLLVLNNGNILSFARGDGAGGNIDVSTNLFVGFGRNEISANAIDNRGGNIRINTTGLFRSPDTKITATSEAGPLLDGTVTLNTQRTGAEETTTPAPDLESSPKIVSACNPSTGPSRFVMMGPGGLKVEPEHPVLGDSRWEISKLQLASQPQAVQGTEEKPMVEATGWEKRNDKLVLIAKHQNQVDQTASKPATCNRI